MTPTSRGLAPWMIVALGGLVAGTIDITYACTFWGIKAGVLPPRIFQSVAAGLLVSASGFVLLFPFYGTNIADMQIAQVAHAVIAILFIALILGHIYIGTLGMEGAFEAMGTGEVDINWAREHHDRWLAEKLEAEGRQPSATPAE